MSINVKLGLMAGAMACLALPVLAYEHDSDHPYAVQSSDGQAVQSAEPGSPSHHTGAKRLLREMARDEGDAFGLAAVPHRATLEKEHAMMHLSDGDGAQHADEAKPFDTRSFHRKED